jgi:serine phosphatase RsbU (regulator of sigma subunit)
VWLLDGRDLLEPAGSLGEPAAGAPLPLRRGLEGRAAVAENGRFVVGLHGQAGLQGALSLAPSTDPLDPLDPEVVTAVALQAGLALDRARLYEQSATVAHELQHSLLAATPPVDPRFEIAAAYRPGVEALDVGGDWHDAFLADDGVLAVVVGDVVGRGLRAASAMGQLRSAVRAVAGPGVGPARLLSRLDRFVGQVEDAAMATLVYAELDLSTGRMRYACAGHPPPLLLRATGEPQLLWDGRSTPLGVVRPGVERTESEVTLGSGDRLLLYTDGLVERRDRRLEDSLRSLAAAACAVSDLPPDAAVPSLMETLLRDERGRDDVCLLLLLWLGDPAITSAAGPDGR